MPELNVGRALVTDSRAKSRLGWVAVALVTFLASMIALFMTGESVAAGAFEIGHFLQLVVILGLAAAAIRFDKVGAIYALLGLFSVVRFELAGALIMGVPLIGAGVLFWLGHPSPRNRAYQVVLGVPLAVAVVSAVIGLIGQMR